jgi:OFA family oxalate/formate antiporter-like MFS transporter
MKEEHMELTASQIKGRRNLYLFVSSLGLLVLGLIYAWSIFSGPLAAYTGYNRGDLQFTFTISMIFFCLSMLAAAFINKKLSIRSTLLIAAVLIAAGFAGTAMFSKEHIGVIYVCYGILCASACGIGYNTIISRVGIWFPDKTGFASGIMMMGFGLGGLILGTGAAKMISAIGLQTTFYVLAVIGFLVIAVIAALIKPAPQNIVREMAPQKLAAGSGDRPIIKDGYMYTSPIFIAYCVFAICAIAAGLTLIGSAKPGMEIVGGANWAGFATLFVGLVSTLNGVSRLIVGTIYDKTSLFTALFIIVVAGLLASCGLTIAYANSIPVLYVVAGLFLAFSYGGIPVVAAAFAREGFGAKNYPTNLAVANLNIALGAFLSQGVISMTSPDGTATHLPVWLAVIGVSAVAFLGVIAFILMYRGSLKTARQK